MSALGMARVFQGAYVATMGDVREAANRGFEEEGEKKGRASNDGEGEVTRISLIVYLGTVFLCNGILSL